MESKLLKTPTYTRKANLAYIKRQKDTDLQSYNERNHEYLAKSKKKFIQNATPEEIELKKKLYNIYMKKYMKIYNENKKNKIIINNAQNKEKLGDDIPINS